MDQESIDDALQAAAHHHEAGRLREAEGIYRRILARVPDDPDALHLLGLVALQRGDPGRAADLLGRAVEVRPDEAAYRASLADAHAALGKLDRAVEGYREARAVSVEAIRRSSASSVTEQLPARVEGRGLEWFRTFDHSFPPIAISNQSSSRIG